jgi:hypothetical protein
LIVAILESMRLVANEQIAAVWMLDEPTNVRPDAFVAGNEYIEEFCLAKAIYILFDRFAICFGQCHGLDHARSEPLDKFVLPILDETAGANDNDAFRGWFATRLCRNASLEQGVN